MSIIKLSEDRFFEEWLEEDIDLLHHDYRVVQFPTHWGTEEILNYLKRVQFVKEWAVLENGLFLIRSSLTHYSLHYNTFVIDFPAKVEVINRLWIINTNNTGITLVDTAGSIKEFEKFEWEFQWDLPGYLSFIIFDVLEKTKTKKEVKV